MHDQAFEHSSATLTETTSSASEASGADENFMLVPESTQWPTGPLVLVLVLSMMCMLALMRGVSSLVVGLVFAVPMLVFCLWLVIRSTMRLIGSEEDSYPGRADHPGH
jgi:Zn-dependent protease with chaperone function